MVCYDGQESSVATLKVALEHAKVWNASLEIVNTFTRQVPLDHKIVLEMEQELEASVKAQIGGEGVAYNIQLLITSQDAGEELISFSEEKKIGLIFLGIVKKSKVNKLIFGSTAQYVILNAPCPVVAVK